MTDPLGQSQVIPYVLGLARQGYQFTILSFEKKKNYLAHHQTIESILQPAGIRWVPLRFSTRPPLLSKLYDAIKMRSKAFQLHRQYGFDMTHCRSYPAADVGLRLKRKKNVRFFFDMRGFWADEKKDGGAWDQKNPLFRRVYKYYKKKETEFLHEADHIISLTEAGKRTISGWPAYEQRIPITVIPCCSDMDHFSLLRPGERKSSRVLLDFPEDALVVSYLGSIGSWYMLEEMLELFAVIKNSFKGAKFFFITHSDPALILGKIGNYGIKGDEILIRKASRKEVPVFVKASDINISFIRPVFSKLASSPTKLGEVMAMGIPVIVNSGIGDVKEIIDNSKGGIVINEFTKDSYQQIVKAIPQLLSIEPSRIRESIYNVFSLQRGIGLYEAAYQNAFKE